AAMDCSVSGAERLQRIAVFPEPKGCNGLQCLQRLKWVAVFPEPQGCNGLQCFRSRMAAMDCSVFVAERLQWIAVFLSPKGCNGLQCFRSRKAAMGCSVSGAPLHFRANVSGCAHQLNNLRGRFRSV